MDNSKEIAEKNELAECESCGYLMPVAGFAECEECHIKLCTYCNEGGMCRECRENVSEEQYG